MIVNQIGRHAPVASDDWHVGHGDLHWANLTAPQCMLLDWEHWGLEAKRAVRVVGPRSSESVHELRDTNGLPCRLVTATRDRRSDLDTEPRTSSWGDAPAFGSRAMPWYPFWRSCLR